MQPHKIFSPAGQKPLLNSFFFLHISRSHFSIVHYILTIINNVCFGFLILLLSSVDIIQAYKQAACNSFLVVLLYSVQILN